MAKQFTKKKHVSKKIFEKNGDHFKIMWGAFVCHEFVFFFEKTNSIIPKKEYINGL